ncbi:MFS transporter [Edaphobacter albus]|uniref:MFS transporter n=1 Tax=Edaphobacter sp. 4G125 TaxID=2763071 RepID=UPI001648931F|nr:MFS transporter [Edaphobacter sp. 4G125]QNI35752.1 MFS transporter [Edaphobacter sp. 4G125]
MIARLLHLVRSHRRWQIVALLFLFSVVNNLDRQTLSVLAPTLQKTLQFGPQQYSYIVTAFLAAYTLGYLFSGALLDRFGVKKTLAAALLFWTIASILHATATGWRSLLLLRFLLGLGESFTSPAGIKALAEWVPARERGLSAAIFTNGNIVGAILAPPIVTLFALHYGWRSGFIAPALTGLVLLFVWNIWYHGPKEDPCISEAEREIVLRETAIVESHAKTHVGYTVVLQPLFIGFFLMRFLTDSVTYFFSFWMPSYLSSSRGFSLAALGAVTWIPFLASDCGGVGGGAVSDWLIRHGLPVTIARKRMLLLAALLMTSTAAVVLAHTAAMAIALMALAFAAQSWWMANQLALISESAEKQIIGRVLAFSALGGSLGGMFFTLITGHIIATAGYRPVFLAASLFHVTGWMILAAAQRAQSRYELKVHSSSRAEQHPVLTDGNAH